MNAGSSEKVRVTSGGYVGIGTDSPLTELHIHAANFTDITIQSDRTSGNIGGINFRKGGAATGIQTAQYFVNTDGAHFFHSQGSERLKIASDGDLTIRGNDNAELKLRCGTSTGNNVIAFLNSSGTTKGNIFYDSDHNFMVFKTDGTASSNERLRIKSDGDTSLSYNLLIPEDKKIHLEGSSADDYNAIWKADTENTVFVTSRFHIANIIDSNNDDPNAYWSVRKDGTTLAGSDELMRVQSDGKVGINETSPDTYLHAKTGTDSALVKLEQTATNGRVQVQYLSPHGDWYQGIVGATNTGDYLIYTGQSKNLTFHTSGELRQKIQGDGKVIIGGNANQTANRDLSVVAAQGNSNEAQIGLQPTNSSGNYNPEAFISAIADGTYGAHMYFKTRDTSGNRLERLRITSAGKIGIGVGSPDEMMEITNTGGTGSQIQLRDTSTGTGAGDGARFGYNGSGAQIWNFENTYTRFATNNVERLRITSGGQVNIGDSEITNSTYTFQVAKDLGTPSSSGTGLARFKNANSTYSQDLNLLFNSSKDIIWVGGSGNGGMTWKMGTRGYNWEIGGTNKFAVGNSDVAINGGTDGVLNINTTDGRGSFIRFKENGTSKVWVGSAEGMGVGDQDDACLMSADNIYFRNSTDSYTTLRVSKEGRQTGYKRYPDGGGTLRSNIYYPPTNQYLAYSAPSGGNKWLRFGYFSSRGRYRVTFNTTGGYYSPGSITFDFQLYWASPHVYVGNISKLSSQYVTQFRVTTDSNGNNYYGEVYVSVNNSQTGSHIHCTAQVLGMGDREFNLHNYGYNLSNLSHTSSNISL